MSGEDKAAIRLINLVVALRETRAGLTKQEIFTKVAGYNPDQAGNQMFERDKRLIREMGIGLRTLASTFEDERYRIDPDGYGMAPIEFTREEGAVLALAARAWRRGSLGAVAARTLDKLRALGVDGHGGPLELDLDSSGLATEALLVAINARQVVKFEYRTGSTGQVSQRRVEPWRLHATPTGLYLLAFDLDKQALRVFKLSRICGPVGTVGHTGAFEPPTAEAIRAGFETGATEPDVYQAHLQADPEAARLLRLKGAIDEAGQLVWLVTDPPAAAEAVAALGPKVRAIEPAGLRLEVVRRWQAAAQSHHGTPSRPRAAAKSSAQTAPAARQRRRDTTGRRVGRMLALLAYLAGRGPVPVSELAAHFEASQAEITEELKALWLDVGRPGLAGGDLVDLIWSDSQDTVTLLDGLELDQPLKLATSEAAILLATLRGWQQAGDLPEEAAAGSALAKLEAAFEAAGAALEVTLPPAPAEPAALQTVRAGIVRSQVLQFDYVDGGGHPSHRLVDPARLFNDRQNWLLAAWDRNAGAERYFRLDRISAAQVLDQPATPQPTATHHWDFAGAEHWVVDVAFTAAVRWRAEALETISRTELAGGGLKVRLAVASSAWIVSQALALGGELEILAPEELRAAVLEQATAALDPMHQAHSP